MSMKQMIQSILRTKDTQIDHCAENQQTSNSDDYKLQQRILQVLKTLLIYYFKPKNKSIPFIWKSRSFFAMNFTV